MSVIVARLSRIVIGCFSRWSVFIKHCVLQYTTFTSIPNFSNKEFTLNTLLWHAVFMVYSLFCFRNEYFINILNNFCWILQLFILNISDYFQLKHNWQYLNFWIAASLRNKSAVKDAMQFPNNRNIFGNWLYSGRHWSLKLKLFELILFSLSIWTQAPDSRFCMIFNKIFCPPKYEMWFLS